MDYWRFIFHLAILSMISLVSDTLQSHKGIVKRAVKPIEALIIAGLSKSYLGMK